MSNKMWGALAGAVSVMVTAGGVVFAAGQLATKAEVEAATAKIEERFNRQYDLMLMQMGRIEDKLDRAIEKQGVVR